MAEKEREERERREREREERREGEEFREAIPATERRYFMADVETSARTASLLNMLAGIWLILAPFIWNYQSATPLWNDIIVGALILAVAAVGAYGPVRLAGQVWIALALGIWLIIAPFVLGYTGANAVTAAWNDVILGIIIGVLALWRIGSAAARPE